MIDYIRRRENHVVVAVFANIGCLDMRRVLANRFNAVMAGDTAVHNAGVVKRRGSPAKRCMTIIAGVTACNVCRVLTGSDCTVVTG